jgi:ribosomal protein S18 acetylase RimI-like enzyme
MTGLSEIAYLRACTEADDAFVYDVFVTTWESEVAALPNQNLARHVLRIQHIAQERRFAGSFPSLQRYVVLQDGEPAGRLYVSDAPDRLQVVDLTLVPRFRDRGIGSRILRDLLRHAMAERRTVAIHVPRRNPGMTTLVASLGFDLVAVDDLDNHLEWSPVRAQPDGPTLPTQERSALLLPDAQRG